MQDTSRTRDARMMNAVAGLGGRSAASQEVDLRLGQTGGAAWIATGGAAWATRIPAWLRALWPSARHAPQGDSAGQDQARTPPSRLHPSPARG